MGTTSQLIGMGLRLWLMYQASKQQQQQPEEQIYQTVSDRPTALNELRSKAGSVTVIVGTRDTGKTILSRRFAEFLGRPTFAVSPQQETPRWITRIDFANVFELVPEFSTLILDDLPAYASNRSYNDELVQTLERIVPMVRHERMPPEFPIGRVHLIFCTQSTAQADRYILDCDAALFKPLGLLNEERPNVARIYKTLVNPEFENKPTMWVKSHAYLMTPTWRGVIQVGMTE